MQASGRTTFTRKASISSTWVGQNSAQMLHPLQYLSMTSIRGLLISGISPLRVDFSSKQQPFETAGCYHNGKRFASGFVYKKRCFFTAVGHALIAKKGNVAIALLD
jgi:hypothetical protein